MLEELGLDAQSERVYRAMITQPQSGVHDLAVDLGMSVEDVHLALDALSELSLVHPSKRHASGFWPLSPQAAVDLLLARQRSDLATRQQHLAESQILAVHALAEFADVLPEINEAEVEQVYGISAIRDRLSALSSRVSSEVMTFAPGGAHEQADIEASREPNTRLLSRGVMIRTIYLHSVRNDVLTLEGLDWLSQGGAQVRTIATLPFRMVVLDRQRVVLPMDTEDPRAGVVILRGSGILSALCTIFEEKWEAAKPLDRPQALDPRGLNSQEAEVLNLLAQGLTDESIAKRLGVSPRTARRIAADLMDRLGARSRFEAGVRATREGWLSSEF
jgi:DNA-binding CsgD family transcriptional regulator/sugar-specific transcriptional regulator TrmB